MAKVMGQTITIDDVVRHIDRHSYKGFLKLSEAGYLDATLSTPTLQRWVRQFADIRNLKIEADKRKVPLAKIGEQRRAMATHAFLKFLDQYKKDYRRNHGKDYPESENSVMALNRQFLKQNGLRLEVLALLNAIVPDELTQADADYYHRTHTEVFNGYLDISVITINHRDPKTGALLRGEDRARVTANVQDIARRLKQDGSNFEEVASRSSKDQETRRRGGVFSNISRFDPRLPAAICRTAFGLRNNQFKGPIETDYALHFVKRIAYHSLTMTTRLDPKVEVVRRYIRQLRQEDVLFKSRKAQKVELIY